MTGITLELKTKSSEIINLLSSKEIHNLSLNEKKAIALEIQRLIVHTSIAIDTSIMPST